MKTLITIITTAAAIAMAATGALASGYTGESSNGKYECTIEYKTADRETIDIWGISRLHFQEMMKSLRSANARYICMSTDKKNTNFYGTIKFDGNIVIREEKEIIN